MISPLNAAKNCLTFNGTDCTTCTLCTVNYELSIYLTATKTEPCIAAGLTMFFGL